MIENVTAVEYVSQSFAQTHFTLKLHIQCVPCGYGEFLNNFSVSNFKVGRLFNNFTLIQNLLSDSVLICGFFLEKFLKVLF